MVAVVAAGPAAGRVRFAHHIAHHAHIFFFRSVRRLSKTNIGWVEFARPGKTCHLPPVVFFTQSIHSFCALKVQKVTWNQLTAVNLLGP